MSAHPTIATMLRATAERLAGAGIEDAMREARLILGHALGAGPAIALLAPERILAPEDAVALEGIVSRREAREPFAKIVGEREFWSLPFRVDVATLDPRPESETIVDGVLARMTDRQTPASVLDLGTGTGCLLLAILTELPRARGLGIDLSPAALAIAEGNAHRLGLAARAAFRQGDFGLGLEGPFDIVVSNPPYIATGEIDHLMPEVARYEPRIALDGGPDGLRAMRALARDLGRLLSPQGFAAIEIGCDQGEAAAAIFTASGLAIAALRHDFADNPRVLVVTPNNVAAS